MVDFHCFHFSGCILSLVWKTFSNSSNFSFLLSKYCVFVNVGLISADNVWSLLCYAILLIASASLLIGLTESECHLCCVCSTIVNVLSGGMCVVISCGWTNCCGNGLFLIGRPVKTSRKLICGALSPLTMWRAFARRSYLCYYRKLDILAISITTGLLALFWWIFSSKQMADNMSGVFSVFAEKFLLSGFGLHCWAYVLMNRWFISRTSQIVEKPYCPLLLESLVAFDFWQSWQRCQMFSNLCGQFYSLWFDSDMQWFDHQRFSVGYNNDHWCEVLNSLFVLHQYWYCYQWWNRLTFRLTGEAVFSMDSSFFV